MKRKYQVGGIIYSPLNFQTPKNDIIDISSIISSVHQPIAVDEGVRVEGYSPQFNFNRYNERVSEPVVETVTDENDSPISAVTPVIPITPINVSFARSKFNPIVNPSTITSPTVSIITSNNSERKVSNSNESIWNEVWNEYGSKLGLKDEKAYLHLLGQIKQESDDFKYMEEIADGSAYEGRRDLGNTKKGDGKRYKGRGPIQVTGRSNYEKIYKEFFIPNGLGQYDIVKNPEIANDPRIGSLLSLGWLATTDNGRRAIAESNNYNISALTRAINGGQNGIKDRIRRTNDLLKEYNYS